VLSSSSDAAGNEPILEQPEVFHRTTKGIIALVSLAIGLVLAEGGLRWLAPRPSRTGDSMYYLPDPDLGYKLKPNFTGSAGPGVPATTNSLGFRDAEFEIRKGAGTYRILAVGDSVTAGSGVHAEETYPKVLEDLLRGERAATSATIQVVNAGVGGWAPIQYAAFLEKYGFDLSPDLVIVGLFIGNDISLCDEQCLKDTTAVGGQRVFNKTRFEKRPWPARTALRTHVLLYSKLHMYRLLADFKPRRTRGSVPIPFGAFIYLKANDPVHQAAWDNTFGILARIGTLCRLRRTRLLVVFLPAHIQVEPQAASAWPQDQLDFRAPQKKLLEFCRAQGLECLDLLPAFLDTKMSLFIPNDFHPVAAGHRLIATVIADRLRSQGVAAAGSRPQE